MSGRVRKPVDKEFFATTGQGKSHKVTKKARVKANVAQDKVATKAPVIAAAKATWVPPSVVLSLRDKAPQLELSSDQLTCVGQDGFRMIRATQGVHSGSYYYEVEILAPESDDAHVRVGWSTRQGELQSFVGYDKWSYGFRDIVGSLVHGSSRFDGYDVVDVADRPVPVDATGTNSGSSQVPTITRNSGFGPGDIVGCYIHLDAHNALNNHIRYYKNGVDLGLAFCNVANDDTDRSFPNSAPLSSSRADFTHAQLPPAVYYPAISLYKKACVRVNFGPSFILRPPHHHGAMSMSEVQPMSHLSRKIHERNIRCIQQAKGLTGGPGDATRSNMVVLSRDSCADTRQQEVDETGDAT